MHDEITIKAMTEVNIRKILPPAKRHARLPQLRAADMYNIYNTHNTGIEQALPRRPLRSERAPAPTGAGELQPPANRHADRKAKAEAYVTWEKVHEEITIKDMREANICKMLPPAESHAT